MEISIDDMERLVTKLKESFFQCEILEERHIEDDYIDLTFINPFNQRYNIVISIEYQYITLFLYYYHNHYFWDRQDLIYLFKDIKGIISEQQVICMIGSKSRWLSIFLAVENKIPLWSRKELLLFCLDEAKEFIDEINLEGGYFIISAWNPENTKQYEITRENILVLDQDIYF